MNKKISIIVPIYNSEKYIKRCIDSLINQTYKNIEIVAINDGSSDKTQEILEEYSKTDNRVVVISKENMGVTAARNDGIENATGDYLCFCDSDDWYELDMCETLIDAIKKYGVKIAVCSYIRVENGVKTPIMGKGNEYLLTRDEAIRNIILGGYFTGSLCTKLYDKNLFSNIHIEHPIKYNEDILLNYFVFKKIDSVAFVDKCKYNYYIRNDSSTGNPDSIKANKDCLYVSKLMLDELQGSNLESVIQQRYTNVLINLYRAYNINKKYVRERNETKDKLTYCINNFNNLPKNLKLNIYMIKYIPKIYPLIYKIYDKIRKKNIDV